MLGINVGMEELEERMKGKSWKRCWELMVGRENDGEKLKERKGGNSRNRVWKRIIEKSGSK